MYFITFTHWYCDNCTTFSAKRQQQIIIFKEIIKYIFIPLILLIGCRSEKAKKEEVKQGPVLSAPHTDVRLINRRFPEQNFYLHDSWGKLSCTGMDSVENLHRDFRFLELVQSLAAQPLFWCRDTFDYEIVSYDSRHIVKFHCQQTTSFTSKQPFFICSVKNKTPARNSTSVKPLPPDTQPYAPLIRFCTPKHIIRGSGSIWQIKNTS